MTIHVTSENLLNNQYEYVFYAYDLAFIEQFSKDQANTFTTLGNGWCRFSFEEVYNIMISAIKLYYFKTHSLILLREGRNVPLPDKLRLLSEQLKVPRYIRDIVREFCRPMIFNQNIYLPDIKFDHSFGESGVNLFSDIRDVLSKWDYTISKVGCEIVSIDMEAPSPVPISFYDSVSQEIWMAKQLPEWRLEAVLYLRHLKYQYFEGIELAFAQDVEASRSKRGKGSSNQEDRPFINEPQLFNMRKTGRKVGGFSGFIISTVDHNRIYGYIPIDLRFGTVDEEHFSKTPPQSRRVSDVQHEGRGEYQLKRYPEISEASTNLNKLTKRRKAALNKKTLKTMLKE